MSCITDLIELWDGCSQKDPDKVYLQDIPGVTLSSFDSLTDDEIKTSKELSDKVIRLGAERVLEKLRSFLNPRQKISSIISNQVLGIYSESQKVKALNSGQYQGIQLLITEHPFLSLFVESLKLFTVNAVNTEIKVFDLVQNKEIDSIPITTVAGEITEVFVKKEYKTEGQILNLIFMIDAGLTNVYEADISASGCLTCTRRLEQINNYVYSRGVKIGVVESKIDQNLRSISHTGGLSLRYSLRCDNTSFICLNSYLFKRPVLYASGIELTDQIIYSTQRLNSLTTVRKDDAENLRADLDNRFSVSMESILQNMSLPNNICYECDPIIQRNTRIP